MEVNIDALFSGLVLVVVVSMLLSFLYPVAYGSLSVTKEQQLENIARIAMDKILLTPGYPADWGSNIAVNVSCMTSFGLAKGGSGAPYELDLDKVMRLANNSEFILPEVLHLDPLQVAHLLGLRTTQRYGFMITITPALNMSATELAHFALAPGNVVPSILDVRVFNTAKEPAPASKVTVLAILSVVYSGGTGDISQVNATTSSALTDWQGKCIIEITGWLSTLKAQLSGKELKKSHVSVMIFAEYQGIRSTIPFDFGETLYGSALGDLLFVHFPEDQLPNSAVFVINATELVIPPYYILTGHLINETNGQSGMIVNKGSKRYRVYRVSVPPSDEVVVGYIITKTRGTYLSVAFLRPPGFVQYGTGVPSAMKTSVLQRIVKIGDTHFVFQLTVWREAET